jgi:hypothetical protein
MQERGEVGTVIELWKHAFEGKEGNEEAMQQSLAKQNVHDAIV